MSTVLQLLMKSRLALWNDIIQNVLGNAGQDHSHHDLTSDAQQ